MDVAPLASAVPGCGLHMEPMEHAGFVGALIDLEAAFNRCLVSAGLSDQYLELELLA
jgi:hypothetical protein